MFKIRLRANRPFYVRHIAAAQVRLHTVQGSSIAPTVRRNSRIYNRGFTIVEILVVVAILGILAAILVPVLTQTREKGRQVSCLSNLRQLGLAFDQYAGDNDDTLPSAAAGGFQGIGASSVWMVYSTYPADDTDIPPVAKDFDPTQSNIFPYVKSTAVFVCPDDHDGAVTGLSYAYNSCLTTPSDIGNVWPGKMLASFDKQSDTLLLAEEGKYGTSTNDGLMNMTDSGEDDPGYDFDSYSDRHQGGSNVLLLDGHTKFYQQSKLVDMNLPTGGGSNFCID